MLYLDKLKKPIKVACVFCKDSWQDVTGFLMKFLVIKAVFSPSIFIRRTFIVFKSSIQLVFVLHGLPLVLFQFLFVKVFIQS